jgi:2-polyprenyl-3-methyl-5-hydroxy-6-metoxy-1,4-benzoquinol methylase
LDIGCAYGYFLKCCDEMGYETWGIDISTYAIARAREETVAQLRVFDVNEGLPFLKTNSFDLVTMFDVIEHLRRPRVALEETHRILKTQGTLIVTTPNLNAIERFFKKSIGQESAWHGFHDNTHVNFFTSKSLKCLVQRAGFRVKLETVFHPLPKILQHLANRTGLGGQIWLTAKKAS